MNRLTRAIIEIAVAIVIGAAYGLLSAWLHWSLLVVVLGGIPIGFGVSQLTSKWIDVHAKQ